MANLWSQLPLEIKHMILGYVSDTDSVVYVPKDKRRKIDTHYNSFSHFHDLLTVSKTFINPDEFAFTLLSKASVTFYDQNELKRLMREVSPGFKVAVKRIHFRRSLLIGGESCPPSGRFEDRFDAIGSPANFMPQMPNLKTIYISLDEYCAEIGHFKTNVHSDPPTDDEYAEMMRFILANDLTRDPPEYFTPRHGRLARVIASCVGNRNRRKHSNHAFTRPHNWIRRLVQYAEAHEIEIKFNVTLCISSDITAYIIPDGESNWWMPPTSWVTYAHGPWPKFIYEVYPPESIANLPHAVSKEPVCWSNKVCCTCIEEYRPMHLQAQMSTRDWLLKVDFEGREYHFRQDLAYEMLHAPDRKSTSWWLNVVEPPQYGGLERRPRYAF